MGFCLFGIIGDCSDNKETKNTITSQITACQKLLEENFTDVMGEIKKTSSNINRIIANSRGDIIIENISMSQVAELTAESKIKLELQAKSETVINSLVDKAAEIALEIDNKNTGNKRSTLTKNETSAVTYLKSELTKRTTTTTFSSCVASILNTNEIKAEAEGNIIIRAIIMTQVSKLASKCIIDSFVNQIGKIQTNQEINERIKQEAQIRDHGIFDSQMVLMAGAAAVFVVVLVLVMRSKKSE